MEIDLELALKKIHQLQLEDGDLGAQYWYRISELLRDAAQFRQRALVAESKLQEAEVQLHQCKDMLESSIHADTPPGLHRALKQLANLGERMRLARCRRKISTVIFAERMGVSRETLSRMEKGNPSIAIGTYLRALRVLGLDKDVDFIASDDELTRKLNEITSLD
ncbi:helix-turn-helix domain-containing protein [Pseudoduganella sp. S-14]|uniref:helix-turn-helix domain-containing protein n=1 Tax=Pseudoduganella sp. S-14 TaxID=3404065 RepID=UPI003CEE3E4D